MLFAGMDENEMNLPPPPHKCQNLGMTDITPERMPFHSLAIEIVISPSGIVTVLLKYVKVTSLPWVNQII